MYYLNVSTLIERDGTIYFGPWNAVTTPFDGININLAKTNWSTYLSIVGGKRGTIWSNISANHGYKYISIYSDDYYTIKIWNLNPNQPVYIHGTIIITLLTTDYIPYVYYDTQYSTYTDYPYRSSGGILIIFGILTGIGISISILISRLRIKK